jgi:hypothetical protein
VRVLHISMTSDAIRTQVQTAVQSLSATATCNFLLYGVDEGTTNERFNVSKQKGSAFLRKHMAHLVTFDVIVVTEPTMLLRAFLEDELAERHQWCVVVWAHTPLDRTHGEAFSTKDYQLLLQSASRSNILRPIAGGRRARAAHKHLVRQERAVIQGDKGVVNWAELTIPRVSNSCSRVLVCFASASLRWHALEVLGCAPTPWKCVQERRNLPMLAIVSTKVIPHSATQFVTNVELSTWPAFPHVNAFDEDLAKTLCALAGSPQVVEEQLGAKLLGKLRSEHRVWLHVPQESDPYFAYAWLNNHQRNVFLIPSLAFLSKQFRFLGRGRPNPKFHFKYPIGYYEVLVANSVWYRKPLVGARRRIRYFSSFRQLGEMLAQDPFFGGVDLLKMVNLEGK